MKTAIRLLSYILSCQLTDLSMPATNLPCQPDPPPPNSLQGKNECRFFGRHTPSSPTKKYRGYWDWTGLSSASWPKYEGVPCPLGWHETSPKGRTSTPLYSKASLIPWHSLPDKCKTSMQSKKDSFNKP